MKTTIAIIAAMLLVSGCTCTTKRCPPCPPCDQVEAGDVQARCIPSPNMRPCYWPIDVKVGDRWEKRFVRTACPPGCIDGDGVVKPDCM